MKSDVKGVSTCQKNGEQYETYTAPNGKEYVQYDYRNGEGELFSCIAKSLDEARAKRDFALGA